VWPSTEGQTTIVAVLPGEAKDLRVTERVFLPGFDDFQRERPVMFNATRPR
jgi:hypothetical protein